MDNMKHRDEAIASWKGSTYESLMDIFTGRAMLLAAAKANSDEERDKMLKVVDDYIKETSIEIITKLEKLSGIELATMKLLSVAKGLSAEELMEIMVAVEEDE